MKLNNYPLSRKDNIVVQESGDEVLLYDLNDNKAFCLNETSALVWELCDGNSSVTDINAKLGKKLKQSTSEELVWLALDQLKKEKLLTNAEDIKIDYNGLSRRDAIRKVGFASLVALPVIMAITSPVAAAAGSFCGGTLNAVCCCNLAGGVPSGPSGGAQFCSDVSATCLPTASPCQCFVPAATPQSMTAGPCFLQYPGTCRENV